MATAPSSLAITKNFAITFNVSKETPYKLRTDITDNIIKALRDYLKEYYVNDENGRLRCINGEKVDLDWQKECFTNIYKLNSNKLDPNKLNKITLPKLDKFKDIKDSEMLSDEYNPLDLNDIFITGNDGAKRVCLIGPAGIGKSTLCQKIVNLWARNILWKDKFDFVIWLKLRKLNNTSYDQQRTQLDAVIDGEILSTTGQHTNITGSDTVKILNDNSEKTLFLLDGYDEFVPLNSNCKKMIDQLLTEKIGGKHRYVFVTSRPYHSPDNLFDMNLLITGFTYSHIKKYISKYFKDDKNKAKIVLEFLQKNLSVLELARSPINLELICVAYDILKITLTSQQIITQADLFQHIAHYHWIQYIKRPGIKKLLEKNPQFSSWMTSVDELLLPQIALMIADEKSFLEELAFKAWTTSDRSLIFDYNCLESNALEFYKKHNLNVNLSQIRQTGFLFTNDLGVNERKKEYFFKHTILQEYFAASYLVTHIEKKKPIYQYETIENFFKTCKNNPSMQNIFFFFFGLLKDSSQYQTLLFQEPHDLTSFYSVPFIIRCLNETKLNNCNKKSLDFIEHIKNYSLMRMKPNSPYPSREYAKNIYQALEFSPCIMHDLGLEEFIISNNCLVNTTDFYCKNLITMTFNSSKKLFDIALDLIQKSIDDFDKGRLVGRLVNSDYFDKTTLQVLKEISQKKSTATWVTALALSNRYNDFPDAQAVLMEGINKNINEYDCAIALAKAGIHNQQILDILFTETTRHEHIDSLAYLYKHFSSGLPNLLSIIETKNKNPTIRLNALNTWLLVRDNEFQQAEAAIIDFLNESDPIVANKIIKMLASHQHIESEKICPLLIKHATQQNEPALHVNSIWALGIYGKNQIAAKECLLTIIKNASLRNSSHCNDEIKVNALSSLGSIGFTDSEVTDTLVTILSGEREDEETYINAAEALGTINNINSEVRDRVSGKLRNLLLNKSEPTIFFIAKALAELNEIDEQVMNILCNALVSKYDDMLKDSVSNILSCHDLSHYLQMIENKLVLSHHEGNSYISAKLPDALSRTPVASLINYSLKNTNNLDYLMLAVKRLIVSNSPVYFDNSHLTYYEFDKCQKIKIDSNQKFSLEKQLQEAALIQLNVPKTFFSFFKPSQSVNVSASASSNNNNCQGNSP